MRSLSLSFAACVSLAILAGCPAKVATIEIVPAELKIKNDADTKTLMATPKDKDGTAIEDKKIVWSSSDPAVATVEADTGKVKPVGSGKAVITATIDEATGTAPVEVVLLKGMRLESPAIVVKAGVPNDPLKVAFSNEKGEMIAADAKIEWKSADPNVATVAPDGTVTGVNPGSTTITAKVEALNADVAVTVNPADPVAASDAGPEGAAPPAPTK